MEMEVREALDGVVAVPVARVMKEVGGAPGALGVGADLGQALGRGGPAKALPNA
jgi:hypothetical protein